MNNKNFEYTGWKVNGFVALILILAAIVRPLKKTFSKATTNLGGLTWISEQNL